MTVPGDRLPMSHTLCKCMSTITSRETIKEEEEEGGKKEDSMHRSELGQKLGLGHYDLGLGCYDLGLQHYDPGL